MSTADDLRYAKQRLAAARFVADYWRAEYMVQVRAGNGMYGIGTHPLALVIAALDGEYEPKELGLPEDQWAAFDGARYGHDDR